MYLGGEFPQTLSRVVLNQQAGTPEKSRVACLTQGSAHAKTLIVRGRGEGGSIHRLAVVIWLDVARSNGVVVACLERPDPHMVLGVALAEQHMHTE